MQIPTCPQQHFGIVGFRLGWALREGGQCASPPFCALSCSRLGLPRSKNNRDWSFEGMKLLSMSTRRIIPIDEFAENVELSPLALQSSWWHKNPFKLNKMISKNLLYRWELSTWFIPLCHSMHPSTRFIYPLLQHSELLQGVGVHHCAMEGLQGATQAPFVPSDGAGCVAPDPHTAMWS